jgi:hypothetical protein
MSLEGLKIKIDGFHGLSPEMTALLFIATMPIGTTARVLKDIKDKKKIIIKLGKKLHYLKSLKNKSPYHIKHIEKIESILKPKK